MKNKGTRFFLPESIQELVEITQNEIDLTLLAGGTSIFREIDGDNLVVPGVVVNLDKIDELKKENRTERYFEFGSMITLEDIITRSHKYLPKVLIKGLKSTAPYPVRNSATIGGTIANNRIVSDIIPLLLVFNCKVEVLTFPKGKKKTKWESINQYIQTRDDRGMHLITRVRIPLTTPSYYTYFKTGFKYNLFSEISFSAIAEIEKKSITSFLMALNIENREIIRLREIEAFLVGVRIPLNSRDREFLLIRVKELLRDRSKLSESIIYQISQIILYFLEGFN